MSDNEVGDAGHGRGHNEEEELASKTLHIQSKRFYLDVKQNRRGRFLKIAEVGAGGRKSRLVFAMSTAAEFRDQLTEFSEHYASLGPPNADSPPEDGKLKTAMMSKESRRYYLDMKENQRGRFLRVSMTLSTSMQRAQIVIPAQGMIEVRDTLTELLKEFGTEDSLDGLDGLPEPQSMRVDNKMFYFDVGHNRRGTFMRVSEVRPNYRTAITIPEQFWDRFRNMMSDFIEKTGAAEASKDAATSATTLSSSATNSLTATSGTDNN